MDGQVLEICSGIYREVLTLRANRVTVVGHGRVILETPTHANKAAIVITGNDAVVRNLECRFVEVPDGNGACVRLAGSGLSLQHVFFHSSQQGLLTGSEPGLVQIQDSRFENLGFAGRAHGIYMGRGRLTVRNSMLLAMKNGGHAIKSRATDTVVENSIIAAFSSAGGRLIDISEAGDLTLRGSVLQQGRASDNWELIGYGLESLSNPGRQLVMADNLLMAERGVLSSLIRPRGGPRRVIDGNTVIQRCLSCATQGNHYFKSRASAGLPGYPMLPEKAFRPGLH